MMSQIYYNLYLFRLNINKKIYCIYVVVIQSFIFLKEQKVYNIAL